MAIYLESLALAEGFYASDVRWPVGKSFGLQQDGLPQAARLLRQAAKRRHGLPCAACRKRFAVCRAALSCSGSEVFEFLERRLAVLGQHHVDSLLQELVDPLLVL